MMLDDAHVPVFNPMRQVWFPPDLSNAASLNAMVAHSAAHFARMQGFNRSTEALKSEAEAMWIVKRWMNDPELALRDDILAAVLRLLTYEVFLNTRTRDVDINR